MKNKRTWKKVTEDVVKLAQVIDMAMDGKKEPKSSRNKAIRAVTGIKSNQTILMIRKSNYDIVKYKKLIRLNNPSAYAKKTTFVTLDDIRRSWNDIIAVLERKNSKTAHFLQESKLPFYNGQTLVIEITNGHSFHIKTLEKDTLIIEAAIKDVLDRGIKVKFKLATDYNSTLNIEPVETNHKQSDLSAFRQVDLTFASEEESYVFYYLNKQDISSVERITILNNLITTYLILVKADHEQEGVKS